jgi:2-C-methyl-D-erythritol 4-phosphate cytidylyltransferase / 2-C-methyl-D-erythritol 2,4-cyclodiphosphate synthase
MIVTAIIVAAGKGERVGGDEPKQFRRLGHQAVVRHSVKTFSRHAKVTHIIVVVGAGQETALHRALDGVHVDCIVIGGDERQASVFNGLKAAQTLKSEVVLVHDAARPFIPDCVVDRLLAALETHQGAVPALPVVDTLALGGDGLGDGLGDVVPRADLYRIQTPQAFHLDAVMTSHQKWSGPAATDDAQMARKCGFSVALVDGDSALEKLTVPNDFNRMEVQLAAQMIGRTALGYDVHQLSVGEELWLGGILIPHDQGLAGHSDADVGLHALTDALLGTIGAGDIGCHFPPSDPQWKGARSSRFVEYARDLIIARGGIIDFIDLTFICEAPKIGPHRDAMKAEIAKMLNISAACISIKATTTEGLGFAGRGEGIAAQASASVRVPSLG